MELWFCHNQDLHGSKGSHLVDMGKVSLRSVKQIPVGVSWAETVRAERGHTYVIHCRDRRDKDFYVKFRVKTLKRDTAMLEWTLLTTGLGAPATIHKAQPLQSNAGADGTDSICPKTR